MWVGSALHEDGPACENARSPSLVLSRGMAAAAAPLVDKYVLGTDRRTNN